MRAEIFKQTSFRCSAGIAHNKVLAKLCAGLNKPNKQTILTQEQVPTLFKKVNIGKVRGLVRILRDKNSCFLLHPCKKTYILR